MALGWRKDYLRYRSYFLNIVSVYKQRRDLKAFLELILTLLQSDIVKCTFTFVLDNEGYFGLPENGKTVIPSSVGIVGNSSSPKSGISGSLNSSEITSDDATSIV